MVYVIACEGPLTDTGASFVCRSNAPWYDESNEILVGAPLFAANNLRGSPSGASIARLIGAEKVFTLPVKIESGDPAFELALDNEIAAFIGLDCLINVVHMRSKMQILPVSSI